MSEAVAIIDGYRTPFAKAGTELKDLQADHLGAAICRELLARSPLQRQDIDEVIFGNVIQPAHAANIARVIALKCGLPVSIPACTVHRNCASGMEAITTAAERILSGRLTCALAGGAESMSNAPLLFGPAMTDFFGKLMRAKSAFEKLKILSSFRLSYLKPVITLQLGLTDPVCGMSMGITAENVARDFNITRLQQDQWALESHQRAAAAVKAGRLQPEIIPLSAGSRFDKIIGEDNSIRAEQNLASLQKLRPYFDPLCGTVTVGNACPVTDGAAAVSLCSSAHAHEKQLKPLGWLRDWAVAGLDGSRMGLGPVHATAILLDRNGWSMNDFDLIEINEAFAAQFLGCEIAFASDDYAKAKLNRSVKVGAIDRDRVNVNGGAIAIGHPVGATGARLVITILHELKRRGLQRGLATLCIGGGQGMALALEVNS